MDLLDKSGNAPLYYATAWLKNEMKQVASLNNHKLVAVIGNSCHGKSTLVAALQRESASFFRYIFKCCGLIRKLFNHYRRVNDITKRTAGIESIPFQSKFYGRVLFYDFAGQ